MNEGLLCFKNGRFFITWDGDEANLAGRTLKMYDVTDKVVLSLKEFDALTYERANCSNCAIVCGHKLESGCCGWYKKK